MSVTVFVSPCILNCPQLLKDSLLVSLITSLVFLNILLFPNLRQIVIVHVIVTVVYHQCTPISSLQHSSTAIIKDEPSKLKTLLCIWTCKHQNFTPTYFSSHLHNLKVTHMHSIHKTICSNRSLLMFFQITCFGCTFIYPEKKYVICNYIFKLRI